MIIKLLTEHHLEFLSLKKGCRGLSESSLVKMSNCWKSHALAHLYVLMLNSRVVRVGAESVDKRLRRFSRIQSSAKSSCIHTEIFFATQTPDVLDKLAIIFLSCTCTTFIANSLLNVIAQNQREKHICIGLG